MRRVSFLLVLLGIVVFASVDPLYAADADGGYTIAEPRRTLETIDATYAEMKPLEFTPPADRWRGLQQTRRLLVEGPKLTIVSLGDSIVNDTMRSGVSALIDRAHKNCKVEMTTCVRGSTGCWWYQAPERIKKYVFDHSPDLVIIGGISQRGDIDAIRACIRQIREKSSAEVLLISDVFGRTDPTAENWSPAMPEAENAYRLQLKRLADEEKVGWFDMHAPWGEYIRGSGETTESFKRDVVHATPKGEQIVGRLLAMFLDAAK